MRSLLRTKDSRLLRDVTLVCLADGVVGASFGALAVAGGLPVWVPVVMSLLVFAGAAQFSAVGIVLAGGGPVAAVATGLLLNVRNVPFGLAVADVLGANRLTRAFGAHLISDETVAFALARSDRAGRRAAFWLSGLSLYVVWNVCVLAGALAGKAVGDTDALGLDAAYPAVLIALVLPALRDTGTRRAALLGAAVALAATPLLPPGLPVLLALAGLLAVRRGS
ncbi:AzlC family ABC transporter permease [Streptomyces sp. LX-29]|uniref:AzlC family ABC transporter permease n=1 Tax=Streptomyces sp. LX-29 TaxID=2900152 RepID=UPI00240E8D3A|nr:AzlC family ABC transporter permease [Streptomyces sp. LX-29]WFB10730.1 AzlC family ABC transporter permease [Streptomyces sp. LX-29]